MYQRLVHWRENKCSLYNIAFIRGLLSTVSFDNNATSGAVSLLHSCILITVIVLLQTESKIALRK